MLEQETINYVIWRHEDSFRRANVDSSTIRCLEGCTITETEEKFINGKKYAEKTETITAGNYMNNITWINFFHARVTKSYTFAGYIMTGMSFRSPDGKERVRITWKIS